MKRTTAPGHVANLHVEEDPSSGQRATEVAADVLNAHQEEIANVCEAFGIQLDGSDNTQLLQAIRLAVGGGGPRNAFVNGDFGLWQRQQTLIITDGTARYGADRWRVDPGTGNTGTLVVARVSFSLGQTVVPGDPRFYLVWNQSSGLNGSTHPRLAQRIEHAYSYNGRKVTVSWYAQITTGTATIVTPRLTQHFGGGGSSADVVVLGATKTIATTMQRHSVTFDVPSTAGKSFTNPNHYLEFSIEVPKTATIVMSVADVQMEPGNSPSAFERLHPQTQVQLARRYYEKSYELDTDPGTSPNYLGAQAGEESGTRFQSAQGRFGTPKRVSPTVVFWNPENGASGSVRWGASNVAVSSIDHTSLVTTGYPNTASQPQGKAYAHWTAEAEL